MLILIGILSFSKAKGKGLMQKFTLKKSLYRNQMIMGYVLILPAVIFFAVFFAYSLIQAVRYSMLDWDGVMQPVYVGLQNYLDLFSDASFWKAFTNNIFYTFGILAFGVLPGLLLAYILSRPNIKGRTLFRSVYFFPRIVSAVVYGAVWKWIYDPRNGLITMIVDMLGGNGSDIAITGNVKTAMLGITITGGWTYFGFCMVIFIAAFMGTDMELEEAARLDGAGKWQLFYHVTIPQIKPVINMMLVYTVIDSFKVYDLVLVMTSGGPNDATQIMTYYIYKQAFNFNKFGYGSAAAILLGLFMMFFTVIYNKALGKEDEM
jgi:raffinose/stachyose/melibiose transport system permease protein